MNKLKIKSLLHKLQLNNLQEFWHNRIISLLQRSRQGWSDRDVDHLHIYLSQIISDSIQKLKSDLHSAPGPLTLEEWQETLDKISEGFAGVQEMGDCQYFDPERYQELKRRFDQAMLLFHEYFFNL